MNVLQKPTSRRKFLAGTGVMAGSTLLLNKRTRVAFASPSDPSRGDAVVMIFLRFGADGLSFTPPIGAAYDSYRALRPTLHITPDQSLPLDSSSGSGLAFPQGLDGVVGLHPAFRPLYESVWARGQMAIMPASGLPDSESNTRSHFEAQRYIEAGTANTDVRNGWLTRVIEGQSATNPIPAVTTSSSASPFYRGTESFSVTNLANAGLSGFRSSGEAFQAVSALHTGGGFVNQLGSSTLSATAALGAVNSDGGSGYPNTTIGQDLRDVANMLRANIGLVSAQVQSSSSWDHHSEQGTLNGQFNDRTTELNDALFAFCNDLGNALNETTIFVVSEFGRTIDENGSFGTDHGRGGTSFVIGGNIRGGVYGYDYPDVIEDSRENRRALPVLTDYRKAFDEAINQRVGVSGSFPTMGNLPDLGIVRN